MSPERNQTRADQIRQRRQQNANGPANPRKTVSARAAATVRASTVSMPSIGSSNASRPARPRNTARTTTPRFATPNVVVRGQAPIPSMAAPRRKNGARRRFDVALGMDGVELRLPAVPTLAWDWRYISGALILACAALLFWLVNAPQFTVQAATYNGFERLTALELDPYVQVSGESIFTVDTAETLQRLTSNFPELIDARVEIGFPNNVIVSATERTPVLAWEMDDRQLWVDAEGIAFPARGTADLSLSVTAESSPIAADLNNNSMAQILTPQMIASLEAMQIIAPEGSRLVYSAQHGFGWQDSRGWQVYIGMNLEQIEMKLRVLQAIVDHVTQNSLQPYLISVENVHAPYYRLTP